MRLHTFLLLPLLCGMGCSSGSRSPYAPGFRYAPEPALVDVFRRGTKAPPLSVMVSVIGVRRADEDRRVPPSIEIRVRLENNGPARVSFDPATLQLVTGTLQPFLPPMVRPPTMIDLAAGQTQTINAQFPFPPGANYRNTNIDALRLRWQVRVDNQLVPQTALFERAYRCITRRSDP